ncbi:MAG TPA: lipoyl(octanoyl) transferase LipB [Mesotoga infera]|nr:lipoyl(octanoyl) transferase LipB [Mesotoga sp.]HON28875.1 lipoyl(octanoyl) transferase LipB [Mesotoga infera]HPD38628.1 lipoyl(octanoyl) transferase LipB [Mesotoga infera]HRR44826.1 lipoyl(octanoyl) transferase LipB [Mesotoga sp.]HRV02214.1 lipoyl(octanoyl) transferase LipB [Mesotoga sp.]
MTKRKCAVFRLEGVASYSEGLILQERALERVKSCEIDGVFILLEHRPVITTGRSSGIENLLVSENELRRLNIELYQSSRGGNITYHGPGQIVGYPVLDLSRWRKNLPWYVSCLEELIIMVLKDYGIEAGRKPSYRGVWVGDTKIAAVGIAVKRWLTMHGFALNVTVNKEHFELITPCGISEFSISSINDFVDHIVFDEVVDRVKERFATVFETDLVEVSKEWLER